MTQPPASRRGLRDLGPATLATAAAGLVVSLLVGGTTEGIRTTIVGDERAAIPALAAGVPAPPSIEGVTVRVRPSLPRPIGVVAPLDLAPEPPPPPAADTAVRTVPLERNPAARPAATSPPAPGLLPVIAPSPGASSAPAVVAIAQPPATLSASASAPDAASTTKRRNAKPKAAPADRMTKASSTDRVALEAAFATAYASASDSDSPAPSKVADDDAQSNPEAEGHDDPTRDEPPAHAPAHGRRIR